MNKRTWWKAAAALVVGGVSVAFADAPKVEPAVWTRSALPTPASAAPTPAPVSPVLVVPASATAPAATPTPPPAKSYPLPPKSSSDSVVLPEFKAVRMLPEVAPAEPVASPSLPPIATPPAPPMLPPVTAAKVPVVVQSPIPPASESPKPLALPVPRVGVPEPSAPAIPPLGELAPPAQPAKSVDPAKPLPPLSDFNLRPAPVGNSVKTDGPDTVAPVVPAISPAAITTRPKPVDGPMPPTDKYVFPIPEKSQAIPVTSPKPLQGAETPALPAIPATLPKPEMPEAPAVPPKPIPSMLPMDLPPVPMVLPARPTSIEKPLPPKTELTAIPTPGVDPMTLKQTTMASVIGSALALMPAAPVSALPIKPATPVFTAPVAADPPAKTTDEKLAEAQKEIKRLAELIDGRRDTDGKPSPVDVGAVEEIKRLKDKLFLLNEKVAALEKQIEDLKKSTSLKPSVGPTSDPMTGKGTVRIENDYPVDITIVVNAMSYRVPANTKLDVTVPTGEFTYQLLNSGTNLAPTKSPIKEKEVVRLRIK